MPLVEVSIPGVRRLIEHTKYLVSTEHSNKTSCQRMCLALHGNGSQLWDFYFQPPDGDWNFLVNHQAKALPANDPIIFRSMTGGTSSDNFFSKLEPLQLGTCLAADLPVITPSETGYISSYQHEDIICAERVFLSRNAVEGRKNLPDNGGGQNMSQKLKPIIETRKVHPK